MPFDPGFYGPAAAALLSSSRLPELGPGRPDPAIYDRLAALDITALFAGQPIADEGMARACVGALWLYHDYLDESHIISQSVDSTTGAYWHGLMHRREPDFENAKYWFRRVGDHPVFGGLGQTAGELAGRAGSLEAAAWLREAEGWHPFRFIDTCRACLDKPGPDHDLCRRVSLTEWELLFDFAWRRALGRS
jgi:hypothetical protein